MEMGGWVDEKILLTNMHQRFWCCKVILVGIGVLYLYLYLKNVPLLSGVSTAGGQGPMAPRNLLGPFIGPPIF